jgi:hypothetical protein
MISNLPSVIMLSFPRILLWKEIPGWWRKLDNKELRYIIYQEIMLGSTNRGEWDGRGIQHAWERWDMHTRFYQKNRKRRDHLWGLGINETIILRRILTGNLWSYELDLTGLEYGRIQAFVNMVMNLRVSKWWAYLPAERLSASYEELSCIGLLSYLKVLTMQSSCLYSLAVQHVHLHIEVRRAYCGAETIHLFDITQKSGRKLNVLRKDKDGNRHSNFCKESIYFGLLE